ncbi:hypothetical protein L6164_029412 [Bauhinia variegata]|uniref:Uncharacterized protein n=1 Tax=Bauhinia variegata TaxID=167791 RepID=A0ACB9L9R2_BAUVA|nr:hypothetical protein L6164_029412 [Bauhinia variegata]
MGGLYLSNILGCFSGSSSSESKRYVCNGNVCVLRNQKEIIAEKKSKSERRKQSFGISSAYLSRRMS